MEGMSIKSRPLVDEAITFSAHQLQFIAEDAVVTILPTVTMEELVLIDGSFGPFHPQGTSFISIVSLCLVYGPIVLPSIAFQHLLIYLIVNSANNCSIMVGHLHEEAQQVPYTSSRLVQEGDVGRNIACRKRV